MKLVKLSGLFAAVLLLAGCNQQSPGTAPASSPPSSPPPAVTGTATLAWQAPSTNIDGTPLTDLAGYYIYYGTSASDLSNTIQITTVGIQTYVIQNLGAGTWYFGVRAVTSKGVESSLSAIVSKTIG